MQSNKTKENQWKIKTKKENKHGQRWSNQHKATNEY